MPGPLWVLVIVGALVCVAVTWCGKISVSPEPLERVYQQVMTSGN